MELDKEEAIKFLEQYVDNDCYTEKCQEAHRMAVSCLRSSDTKSVNREQGCNSAGMWWKSQNLADPEKFGKLQVGGGVMGVQEHAMFLALHKILLSIGGSETCFPPVEEDLAKIICRGKFFPGRSKMMKGRPNACHSNTAELWINNHETKDVRIVTGYALSADNIWRQHSWLVQEYDTETQHRRRLIETTSKRVAYFGFELTEEEAEAFYFENI